MLGIAYSSSGTSSEGSVPNASANLRIVEGYALPVLSTLDIVSFDTPAFSPSSRRVRTRFLLRAFNLSTFTSTRAVYAIRRRSASIHKTFGCNASNTIQNKY